MKKIWGLVLASVMAVGVMAGCSNNNNSPAADPGTNTSSPSPSADAAPTKKTFSMLVESHPSWPYTKDTLAWNLIEEKTGVTFDVQVPSGTLEDTINLGVASGTLPDLVYMLERSYANKYGPQGALVNILDYVDDMPNFKKWMEQYPEITKANIAADGKMYMFPNEGIGETNRMTWLYREDIFEKEGLALPQNWDELYTVLKELKTKYPDSYPLSFRFGPNLVTLRNTVSAFDTNDGFYIHPTTGQVQYGPIEDGYKLMVEYFHKFYKEGLIPPDWLTMDTKQWQDVMSNSQSFVTIDYIGRIDFFNNAMRGTQPEYTLSLMPPPAGVPGKQLNGFMHFQQASLTVSSNSKQIKDIMKYMDWFYTEEARDLMSWGVEGETYTVENGVKQLKRDVYVDVAGLRKETNLSTNGTYIWFDYDAHLSLASDDLKAAYAEARKYDDVYHAIPAFTEQEQEIISTVGQAIEKHRVETITKFILGDKSFDEWNQYVDGVKKLGLDQVLELHKTAFDRMNSTSLK